MEKNISQFFLVFDAGFYNYLAFIFVAVVRPIMMIFFLKNLKFIFNWDLCCLIF